LSEEQIPQVIGKTEKTRNGMDGLEGSFTRPRQVRYQAALRPDITGKIDSKVLSNFGATPIHDFRPRPCIKRAFMSHCTATVHIRSSPFDAISLARRFSFSRASRVICRFHLRILLEDLRVCLAKHLCYPLVRYPSGAQPGGIGRARIVDAKVRYFGTPQGGMPGGFKSSVMSARILIAGKPVLCQAQSWL
jgi:hypothetical protein